MDSPADMAERHGRQLARLAELSLSLAEDTHAAALAASEPQQKANFAAALHRVARCARQSIALEARLVRDRARDERAAEAEASEGRDRAVRRRAGQVLGEVERAIYTELDPVDAAARLADAHERLETEALYDDFLDEPVEAHIARLSAELGLTGKAVREYLPRSRRPRFPVRDPDLSETWDKLLGRDDDAAPANAEDAEVTEAEARPIAEASEPASPEPPPPEPPPPQPPPEPDPQPPDPQPPDPPPPEPPPPEPKPYIPPWEQLRPGERFPGSSGY